MIWRTPLPQAVELYNLGLDPSEKNNVAEANPAEVVKLQKRANELAATQANPLFIATEFKAIQARLALPPALPKDDLNEDLDFDNMSKE